MHFSPRTSLSTILVAPMAAAMLVAVPAAPASARHLNMVVICNGASGLRTWIAQVRIPSRNGYIRGVLQHYENGGWVTRQSKRSSRFTPDGYVGVSSERTGTGAWRLNALAVDYSDGNSSRKIDMCR